MQALGLVWDDIVPTSIFHTYHRLEYPGHRGARLLYDMWRSRPHFQVGFDLPSRPLARVLSALAVYEPRDDDFRVRLAGHGLRRHFGRDVTGEKLGGLADVPHAGRHGGAVANLLEHGAPLLLEARRHVHGEITERFDFVALRALAHDGVTPWIVSGIFYHDWRL